LKESQNKTEKNNREGEKRFLVKTRREKSMKMSKTVRLVLAVAGVVMAGGFACAQGPGGPGMGPGFGQHRPPMERSFGLGQFWNNPNLVTKLALTDDQRKAMDGILQDHRLKLIDLQATLQKAELAMGPLMKADTPDRGAIEAQIDRVVSARGELEKANARFLLDIRMQLKPEQWKQLQTMHQNRMEHGEMGEHGRGQWGHDGRGPGMNGPGMSGPGTDGQGNQFHGHDGQFHRQREPLPDGTAPAAPAPPAPAGTGAGTGAEQ
jgi:Spy/CpxP family protein refolding chaperone